MNRPAPTISLTARHGLSFALLNSIPDPPLLEAAQNGRLADDRQIREQAWRLVNDYRGRARMLEFLRSWMNLERLQEIDKDQARVSGFYSGACR